MTVTKLKTKLVDAMSNDELIRAIRTRMAVTLESIEELAGLIREARRRNLSLAEFSTGMPKRLLMVADGKLAAELLFKFADEPAKIDALAGVNLEVQRELAGGGLIRVVEEHPQGDDGLRTVEKTLRQLTGPQVRQAFNEGRYRTPADQRKFRKAISLASRKHRAAGRRSAENAPRVAADTATGELIIGAYRLKLTAFTGALKLLGYRLTRIE